MPTTTESRSTSRSRRRRRFGRRSDRGAALVEFALIALPVFTILFGTIEFGWLMFQYNDIRHGAREGIRLVVVDADVDIDATVDDGSLTTGERLAQATCERMDRERAVADKVEIRIDLTDRDSPANGLDVGDDATITAYKPEPHQLTRMFDVVMKNLDLTEVVTSRLEQDPAGDVHGTVWQCQ